MRARLPLAFGAAASAAVIGAGPVHTAERPPPFTIGIIETVRIEPEMLMLDAKVDTGADSSSLHARNIEMFSRDGREWVRFETGSGDRAATVERPVTRIIRIRRSGTDKERRPVVLLKICIGNSLVEAEVNLTDRTGMSYPMLLGRKLLAGRTIIDPARRHVTRPACAAG